MIVRDIDHLPDSDRDVDTPNWRSRRMLLGRDGMGFSLHETLIRAGTETKMWYKNHVEAVYCIKGTGTLTDLTNDKTYALKPGTLYALNGHEKHILKTETDMVFVCVFNPPCTGREVHDADGVYPLMAEV